MTVPGYWRNEESGVLRPAVEAYLAGGPLSQQHISALRAYFRQWIMSPVWDANPHLDADDRWALSELRRHIDDLTTSEVLDRWVDWAIDEGYDPL